MNTVIFKTEEAKFQFNRKSVLKCLELRKSSYDNRPSNEKLVVAHRVMQLTADRAGLVFCGDIIAVVRSMFLTSRAYQPELYLAQKNDLLTCLKRCDEKGNYILQDLAIRIGSLISFYLSDEYQRLRQKITGTLMESDFNTHS